jgi:hypothetical protein
MNSTAGGHLTPPNSGSGREQSSPVVALWYHGNQAADRAFERGGGWIVSFVNSTLPTAAQRTRVSRNLIGGQDEPKHMQNSTLYGTAFDKKLRLMGIISITIWSYSSSHPASTYVRMKVTHQIATSTQSCYYIGYKAQFPSIPKRSTATSRFEATGSRTPYPTLRNRRVSVTGLAS